MGYHRNLLVWQLSQDLTEAIYRATEKFPRHEQFGLTAQMRRAGSSISANVAEGTGKLGDRELARFLRIARGSSSELDSHIDLARRFGYLTEPEETALLKKVLRIQRMLFGLIQRLTVSP
jgi:four helix bundle protein